MATSHYPPEGYSPELSQDVQSTPGSAAGKRKSEGGIGAQSRSKRSRYISVACNECKRRKIKCNGQTPCQRCGHLGLECIYASNCCSGSHLRDDEEFQQMKAQIASLQDQVNALFASITASKAADSIGPISDQYAPQGSSPNHIPRPHTFSAMRSKPPAMHGPLSVSYGLDVAKHSLASMGITPDPGVDGIPADQPSPERSIDPELTKSAPYDNKDPLWSIKREEALRLLKLWDDEIGVIYPMVNIEQAMKHADLLWTFIEAAIRSEFMPSFPTPGADALDDEDTNIVKMILANTLTFEGNGYSELGNRLFQSVEPYLERRLWQPADLKGIKLIALASKWFFHEDNEEQSWRLIGIAGRMCLELGLHRKASIEKAFPSAEEQNSALALFWTVRSLDRRWSIGTGLPFSISDADIDSFLPKPEAGLPRAMYGMHNILSKVWYLTTNNEGEPRREEMEQLDQQLGIWYREVSPELQLDPVLLDQDLRNGLRAPHHLRFLLYLRRDSVRLAIYRPILHSATTILENKDLAQRAVDIATAIIRLLTRINQLSDLYRTQQVRFNHFLVIAIAALFLAVCHAPAEFNQDVREDFFMASDLIKNFSARSRTSRRLWATIRQLRDLFQRLDALKSTGIDDPHSNAALAMAGLAGQPVDSISYGSLGNSLGPNPQDGLQMSNELNYLFEKAGTLDKGFTGGLFESNPSNGEMTNQYPNMISRGGEGALPAEAQSVKAQNDEEIMRIVGQIFDPVLE